MKDKTALFEEARDRFKRCEDWEGEARRRFVDDRKFANADSDNGWQWADDIRSSRQIDNRPCLTINKTRQHNLHIINDARQNKPEVDVRPIGSQSTYQAAQVFESIVRHIEYISNAQSVYDRATLHMVEGGIGYWRVLADYADNESLDQEIFIRPIKDPMSVYLDPDIREEDGSDARFGFVFDDMSHDEFRSKFPHFKDDLPETPDIGAGSDWLAEDHIRVAEYYRKDTKPDKLISWVDEQGERQQEKSSKLGKVVADKLLEDPDTKSRDLKEAIVEWYLIAGDKIVDKAILPGRYIPIVRVVGEETIIDGRMDRKGHTRALKDVQRQYNYWCSSAAEHVALQGKSPYVAAVRSIEGLEGYWQTANTENHSVLPYNDIDDSGQPIAPPQRSQPPVMAPAYVEGMNIARQELMEVSGQYQAEMGAPGNEKSGKAIQERQRQSDNATYHYVDHLAMAIRFTGKILIDLIPKIYDTPRVVRILGEDGSDGEVQLDPNAPQAYTEKQGPNGQSVKIFNPNMGKYDVQSDVGPDYGTKRQEAFNAIMQLIQSDSQIMSIAGDILFKSADFPLADELAERFQRMVPAQAMGGPTPELQQAQQQIQQMQSALEKTVEALGEAKSKQKIEGYRAETDRIALGKDIDPLVLIPIIRQAVMQALGQPLPADVPAIGQALQQPEPAQAA